VARLTIRLFGTPSFAFDGVSWHFGSPRCLPLLTYLVLRREPVPRAAAAAALWPDELDEDARANLRRHLHHLRRALPPSDAGGWFIDADGRVGWNNDASAQIDVVTFLQGIGTAGTRPDAVALYEGDLLEGCEDEWLVVEREHLRAAYLQALFELASARRRERDFLAAAGYAERLLAHDDLREDALRELMAARYESGDRTAALATYERFAARVRTELRADPTAETIALRDAVAASLPLQHGGAPLFAPDALAPERDQMPFVGRRGELETLQRAWSRAARRFGGTVLVAGEAGIGKSRLCAELAALAERQGARVLVGATTEPESGPYQALIAAAQHGLPLLARDGLDVVWAATLTRVLPEIRAIRPDLAEPAALDEDRARTRLHEALARFFEAIAQARPLVLVLEDVHWAHRDTIDAIEALARRATGAPLLLVLTYRAEETGLAHPLRVLARTLQSERRAARVMLGPLDGDAIGDLIARMSPSATTPVELTLNVVRLSEGNPLFARELLRGFAETGVVPDGADASRGVAEAIMARVERLSPEVRAVADAAATVGRDFTLELAAAASGRTEREVSTAVDDLVERHLVRESAASNWTYTFTHALIASTIYARTPAARRPARHRRIARLLSSWSASDRATLGTLARHWEAAEERPLAYEAYLRAAQAAGAVYARAEAIAYAQRAAALAADDAARFAALEIAVREHERSADAGDWAQDLERLEGCAARLGDDEQFTALASRSRHELRGGDAPRIATAVDAMLALSDRSDDPVRRAVAFESLGNLHIVRGAANDAAEALRTALRFAERAAEPDLVARVRQGLIKLLMRKGDLDEAAAELDRQRDAIAAGGRLIDRLHLARAEATRAIVLEDGALSKTVGDELLQIAEQIGDVDSAAQAHGTLAYAAHLRGDARAMRAHSDHAIAAFERLGHARSLGVTLVNRGMLEFELGRADGALAFWERAELIWERLGSRDGVVACSANRAEALLLSGRADAARPIAQRALELVRSTGDARLIADALVLVGAAECEHGERAAGLQHLREGIARRRTSGGLRALVDDLCFLIEALVAGGDADAAADVASELAAFDAMTAKYPVRVLSTLGLAAAARGDHAAAEKYFQSGRRLLQQRVAALDSADAKAYGELTFSRRLTEAAISDDRVQPTPGKARRRSSMNAHKSA
jgi:predicted ATPase/DNA-binding SARP family transcriptional activator